MVVGGGSVAERKTISLLEAGADVTIVSPDLTPKLLDLSQSGKIDHIKKTFEEKDLSGEFIVIAATNSPEVNVRIARACKSRHVLVNVAVPPEESSFIVPSVVDRGELLIAVSTSGVSPALAKKIRRELEARYGPEYDAFLNVLAAVRVRILEEVPDEQRRKTIFQAIIDSDVIDLFRQGRAHEAEGRMIEIAGLRKRA